MLSKYFPFFPHLPSFLLRTNTLTSWRGSRTGFFDRLWTTTPTLYFDSICVWRWKCLFFHEFQLLPLFYGVVSGILFVFLTFLILTFCSFFFFLLLSPSFVFFFLLPFPAKLSRPFFIYVFLFLSSFHLIYIFSSLALFIFCKFPSVFN